MDFEGFLGHDVDIGRHLCPLIDHGQQPMKSHMRTKVTFVLYIIKA